VQLPDNFHDFFTEITGSGPTAEILAHCRRELMHGVWAKIFDGDFMEAYEHGIVLECQDGISRRFFPRVFTYSADYPEKLQLFFNTTTVTDWHTGFCSPASATLANVRVPDAPSRRRKSLDSEPKMTQTRA
jgi:hypothetical protein